MALRATNEAAQRYIKKINDNLVRIGILENELNVTDPFRLKHKIKPLPRTVERYKRMIAEWKAENEKITAQIETLDSPLRDILKLHYLQGMKFEDVADAVFYSVQYTMQLHTLALAAFYDKYKDTEEELKQADTGTKEPQPGNLSTTEENRT